MRKLIIIISLLIFGFALSYDEETYIFDIEYSKEFEVPIMEYPSSFYNLYFRLPHPSTNEKLEITTKYAIDDHYKGNYICGYAKYPTDEELKKESIDANCQISSKEYESKDKAYRKLIYSFDQFSSGVTYLVIKINMNSEFKYLSVLVSPYKKREKKIEREIEYDKEVIIDSETLRYTEKHFIFNTESKNGNGESMTIKLHKDDINDFIIALCGVKNLEDEYYTDIRQFMSPTGAKDDGEYKIYKYSYTQIAGEPKYLFISIMSMNNYELEYFSFTLNSASTFPSSYSSGLSLGIITLITILSLL